jgi:hypothetical protein
MVEFSILRKNSCHETGVYFSDNFTFFRIKLYH